MHIVFTDFRNDNPIHFISNSTTLVIFRQHRALIYGFILLMCDVNLSKNNEEYISRVLFLLKFDRTKLSDMDIFAGIFQRHLAQQICQSYLNLNLRDCHRQVTRFWHNKKIPSGKWRIVQLGPACQLSSSLGQSLTLK